MTKNVFVCYREHTTVVSDTSEPDDPFSGFIEEQREWDITKVTKSLPPTPYHESFKLSAARKVGDDVFVVYVRYRDGGTFGSTSGIGHIVDVVTTVEDAQELVEMVRSKRIPHTYSTPWLGFFARLEDVGYEKHAIEA
jgi:predicted TIM-barrel enzyme